MSAEIMRIRNTFLFPAFLCSGAVLAQVPPDHLVLGTTPAGPGTSGLFLVSLETGGVTRVAGLPPTYVQTQSSSTNGGVWSVVRRADERVVLGTGARSGVLSMHMVTLNTNGAGSTVSQTKTVDLGTIQSGWFFGTNAACLMPDGRRVLVGGPRAGGFASGPMAGHQLGIVDFDATPPKVTPIPLASPMVGNFTTAITMSRDGRYAYAITGLGLPNNVPYRVYQVDIEQQPARAILIHQAPGRLLATPTMVGRDTLYIAAMDSFSSTPSPTEILEFGIQGWGRVSLKRHAFKPSYLLGGTLTDPASGLMLLASFAKSPNPFSLFFGNHRTGSVKLLTNPPSGGWGAPQCADLHASLDRYGRTAHEHEVGFETHPNPGGIPEAGNSSFGLTLETKLAPASPAALFVLGVKPVNVQLLATTLLVDPAIVVGVATPTPGNPVQVPLPIPSAAPKGSTVFAQWALCASGACAASRGMKIVIR